MINKKFLIKGMTCNSCARNLKEALLRNLYIIKAEVSLENDDVMITYEDEKISENDIEKIVEKCGFFLVLEKKERRVTILEWLLFAVVAIVLYKFFASRNFMVLKETVSYPMIFFVGVLTSFHCISMCGGICIAQGVSSKSGALLYNLGRITSYTLIGVLIGFIGSTLQLSIRIQSYVTIIAGIFMILMSLQLLGITNIWTKIDQALPNLNISKFRSKSPYIIGLLNGFMPCGPLQAMQLYALGTGSPAKGGLVMFLFALGTSPLLYSVGLITRKMSKKNINKTFKLSGVLVMLLALVMVQRGLTLAGINPSEQIYKSESDTIKSVDVMGATQIIDGVQYVTVEALVSGYKPSKVSVVKGIPVVFNIVGRQLTGCNNAIIIPSLNMEMALVEGDNIIQFTPDEIGTIHYSCWMGMIPASIEVVENINSQLSTSPEVTNIDLVDYVDC